MKAEFLRIPLLVALICLLALPAAEAQKSKSKKSSGVSQYLDDKGKFTDRLWYGGGFNLGFSGNDFYSLFNVGVSPMVGYKIFEPFSIGPRVSLQYNYIKGYGTDGNIHRVHPMTYAAGVFARYKVFRSIFAHAEYEFETAELPYFSGPLLFYDVAQARIATARVNTSNAYIGAGYNSSANMGGFGYEILLLYNLLNDNSNLQLPINIRFGFTYNF